MTTPAPSLRRRLVVCLALAPAACGTDGAPPDPVAPPPPPAARSVLEACVAGGGALAPLWATENFHGAVTSIAVAGNVVIVASEDGSVKQWAVDGAPTYGTTLAQEGAAVRGLVTTHDGDVLGADDLGRLAEWRLADARPLRSTPILELPLAAVAVDAEADRVAVGGGAQLHVVERTTHAVSPALRTLLWDVDALAFAHDDVLLTAGHNYGTPMIERRDVAAPLEAVDAWNDQTMAGHVRAVAVDRTGARVFAAGDGFVAVFDAAELAAGPRAIAEDPTHAAAGLVLLSGGELIATSGAEGTVRLWRAEDLAPAGTLALPAAGGLGVDATGARLFTAGADGVVRAVDCR